MNAMVPVTAGGKLSTRFAKLPMTNDLSAGIQQGFGLIGYKGKAWSIRYRWDTKTLMRDDGDGPRNSIEVVIVKSASVVSKIFYEGGYVEGSTDAPTCFSTNGVAPDPGASQKQCASCAACPQNKWGSRKTAAGKDGKACSDSKRLAVVPLADIPNKSFGGPMLLRVPAASMGDLAAFGERMQSWGYPYNSLGVRISFDPAESYPKFVFKEMAPLSDDQADQVLEMFNSPVVTRILAEGSEHVVTPEVTAPAVPAFEAPKPVATAPQPAPVAVAIAPAPEPVAPVADAVPPVAAPVTGTLSSFEDDLDDALEKLMPSL